MILSFSDSFSSLPPSSSSFFRLYFYFPSSVELTHPPLSSSTHGHVDVPKSKKEALRRTKSVGSQFFHTWDYSPIFVHRHLSLPPSLPPSLPSSLCLRSNVGKKLKKEAKEHKHRHHKEKEREKRKEKEKGNEVHSKSKRRSSNLKSPEKQTEKEKETLEVEKEEVKEEDDTKKKEEEEEKEKEGEEKKGRDRSRSKPQLLRLDRVADLAPVLANSMITGRTMEKELFSIEGMRVPCSSHPPHSSSSFDFDFAVSLSFS